MIVSWAVIIVYNLNQGNAAQNTILQIKIIILPSLKSRIDILRLYIVGQKSI